MVFQTFANYAGVEKFENVNEEVEYFQDDKNKIEYFQDNTEEEVIEYQTELSEKLIKILNEVRRLKGEIDSSTDPNAEVLLEDLEGNIKSTIKQIEKKELSPGDSEIKHNFLVSLFNDVKSMFKTKEGFQNNKDEKDEEPDDEGNDIELDDEGNDEEGNDEEGNDEEGNDEEGSDEDAFVVTDDNNEIVEGFQNNNNTIEYQTGAKSYLSLDLLLRSVLYACLFFVLAHPDTFKFVGKLLKKVSKSNLLYVHMVVFAVVYYLLNLFI